MQIKLQYAALVACAMLVLPSAAFAEPSKNSQLLQIQMARITCNTNFVTGYINDVISIASSASSLSQDVDKINTDVTTLQGYADSNDKTSFASFVKNTYRPDLKTANTDARSTLKAANLTSDQKATLKSDYNSLKLTLKSCLYSTLQQFATAKTAKYETAISKMQNRSYTMSAKRLDTTSLNQVIAGADSQLESLKNAISSANDTKSLKSALRSNCLYNGCKNGTNFHFAAKSAVAAQQSALNYIQTLPNATNYSSEITQAQNDLNGAQSILDIVGTGKYTGTQATDVWNYIKDASHIIHQLWKELGHK